MSRPRQYNAIDSKTWKPAQSTEMKTEVYRSMGMYNRNELVQNHARPVRKDELCNSNGSKNGEERVITTPRVEKKLIAPLLPIDLETYGLQPGFWCGAGQPNSSEVCTVIEDAMNTKGIDFEFKPQKSKFKCTTSLDGVMVAFSVRIFKLTSVDLTTPVLGGISASHLIVIQDPCENCNLVQRPFVLQLFAQPIVDGCFSVNFQIPPNASCMQQLPIAAHQWNQPCPPLGAGAGRGETDDPDLMDNGIRHLVNVALTSSYLDTKREALNCLSRLSSTSQAARESLLRTGSLEPLAKLCGPPDLGEGGSREPLSREATRCRQCAVTIVANALSTANEKRRRSETGRETSAYLKGEESPTPSRQGHFEAGEQSRSAEMKIPVTIAAVLTSVFLAVVDSHNFRFREFRRQACRALAELLCYYPRLFFGTPNLHQKLPTVVAAMTRCRNLQSDQHLGLLATRALNAIGGIEVS